MKTFNTREMYPLGIRMYSFEICIPFECDHPEYVTFPNMYRRNMYISHTTFTYFIYDFKYLPEICLSHIACTIGRAGQARSRLYFSFVFPFSFSLLNFFFGGYGEKERRGPHYDRFCGLWSWKKRILEKLPPLLRQRWSRIHGPRAECSGRANKR